jgi:hypothetical protein
MNPPGKFSLDCRRTGEYFLVKYFHRFLFNPQPALWPSGVEYEKEFPEGADKKVPGEFLFLRIHFSSMALVSIGPIKS